jgi:DNA-binding NarL/FixJ family response regulator
MRQTEKPTKVVLCGDESENLNPLEHRLSRVPEISVSIRPSLESGSHGLGLLNEVGILVLVEPRLDEKTLELVCRFRRGNPNWALILMVAPRDNEAVFVALKTGVEGCLVAGLDNDRLKDAIAVVLAGEAYLSPRVTGVCLEFFQGLAAVPRPPYGLTNKEFEVVRSWKTDSADNSQDKSENDHDITLRVHYHQIRRKLEVETKAAALNKVDLFLSLDDRLAKKPAKPAKIKFSLENSKQTEHSFGCRLNCLQ